MKGRNQTDLKGMLEKNIYHRLPSFFQELLEHSTGRERDLLTLSSLTVISNCLPFVSGIYNGSEVYPHIYLIIIAPPASGKGRMTLSKYLIDGINNHVVEFSTLAKKICEQKKKDGEHDEECPEIARKIVPANISTTAFYKILNIVKEGVLMFETEADTLTKMLGNDWSDLSDVLRKAFHTEVISLARADGTYLEVVKPKLSILLSGTPEQLKLLMKNKENGLFSRFLIYQFNDVDEFIDVFAVKAQELANAFKIKSDEMLNLFKILREKKGIKFNLTARQEKRFLRFFRKQQKNILEQEFENIISNLKRFALIAFRIAMILTVLRHKDKLENVYKLECSDKDFLIALSIVETLLEHTKDIIVNFDSDFLPELDKNILDDLPVAFSRKDAIISANKFGMPKRTLDDKLNQWILKKIIHKPKHGSYRKL
ncbi:Protein of unknown function [Paenimyroides ummariense]|uniref:DUF3987 domain-containing protein n=1 Tax=Paenimyroides ummariense TaxID=913024 RepID=A0A1I4W6W3_9FLAO|nr:DUF3987 domain-containing protein [Paenimyroides ummariense]SFN09454.1 Protein of unknown function [Paenimyroides ummariense]